MKELEKMFKQAKIEIEDYSEKKYFIKAIFPAEIDNYFINKFLANEKNYYVRVRGDGRICFARSVPKEKFDITKEKELLRKMFGDKKEETKKIIGI